MVVLGILSISSLVASLEIQEDLEINWTLQVLNSQNLALVVGGKKIPIYKKRQNTCLSEHYLSQGPS